MPAAAALKFNKHWGIPWSQNFLANYIAINIEDELARIPGIGQVKIMGAGEYAMRVWLAPDKLAKLQLTVADLAKALSAQNVVNPAGTIGGEPAPPGQQYTYTVRAQGRLLDAEQFGNAIVRANPDGSFVRLKDVRANRNRRRDVHPAIAYQRQDGRVSAPLSEPRLKRARGGQ
jgi:multidrug efflux pump subunit AcrB